MGSSGAAGVEEEAGTENKGVSSGVRDDGSQAGDKADEDDVEGARGVADDGSQAGDKESEPAELGEGIGVFHPDGDKAEDDGVGVGDASEKSPKFAE